jgi:hypothetical protein
VTRNGQADAAPIAGGPRAINPVETFKEVGEMLAGNADATVAYSDGNLSLLPLEMHRHAAPGWRILQGIAHQVEQHLQDATGIEPAM